jgi:O-glycosyl hydrolase
MWWLAVTAYDYKDGLVKVDSTLHADSISASKLLWTLGNFSRFIRPGFQRIETDLISKELPARAASELLVSSYVSNTGSDWATVIVNLSDTSQSVHVELEPGVTQSVSPTAATEWDIHLTNEDNNLTWAGRTNNSKATLPARSIATLIRSKQREG